MKTVRITSRWGRNWLATVIGILGIIGGARQQVWANNTRLPQPIDRSATAGSAGNLPANFSNPERATR